jgi:hypothetical protein
MKEIARIAEIAKKSKLGNSRESHHGGARIERQNVPKSPEDQI